MTGRVAAYFEARRLAAAGGWRRTDALVRAVSCGLGLLLVGLVLHRLELVLLGLPLVLGLLLTAPPSGTPSITARPLREDPDVDREEVVAVTVDAGEGAVFTAVRMPVLNRPDTGPVHLVPATATEVRTRMVWHTWGEATYLRPDHLFASHDGLYVYGPVVGESARHTVLPPVEALPPGPLPPRAAGLVGAHRSARPGDGTELRDIRPFRPGDRLRRIDWRVSLRAEAAGTRSLHVREHHAEADADLLLALDTRLDVGPLVGEWNTAPTDAQVRPGGSLDLGVRAVSTLAATFLRHGDRVGLIDLGHPRAGVHLGSGHRQLQRIRHQLVHATRGSTVEDPVLNHALVPKGATLVVLSPFLDDRLVEQTTRLARTGRLVVAVDLLPADLTPDATTPWGDAVLAVLRAEHRLRRNALTAHGVLVRTWSTSAEIATLLRAARRRRTA